MAQFKTTKAPNLVISENDYKIDNESQFRNQLRLYFNQVDSGFEQILIDEGGSNLSFPHIAASDSTDQIAGGNNTATAVKFNTLESGGGWTLNSPGSATAEYSGVYRITFRLQFINTANANHYVTAWLKVDNVDVVDSATIFTVPARKSASPGEEGYLAAYSEATFTVIAGEEIELYWATDLAGNPTTPTDGVFMLHDAVQASPFARPAIPSATGSITFVSRT